MKAVITCLKQKWLMLLRIILKPICHPLEFWSRLLDPRCITSLPIKKNQLIQYFIRMACHIFRGRKLFG
jgi:hypothetical protein